MLNQSTSAFGDGWTLQGLEQVIPATDNSGVILSLGDNGAEPLVRRQSRRGEQLHHPGGRLLDPDQDQHAATPARWPTAPRSPSIPTATRSATIDLNGLHTTYTFSSGLLTKITDPYGNVTTLHLQLGQALSRSRTRPAG